MTKTTPSTAEQELPEEMFCKCKNGRPCFDTRFNIKKAIAQARQEGIAEIKKKDQEIIILKSDITYAIGYCQGLGHPIAYLEKRYPELTGQVIHGDTTVAETSYK